METAASYSSSVNVKLNSVIVSRKGFVEFSLKRFGFFIRCENFFLFPLDVSAQNIEMLKNIFQILKLCNPKITLKESYKNVIVLFLTKCKKFLS